MVAIDDLLSQAVSSEPSARKEAFLKLLASDDWNKALSESILEKQIVEVDQKLQPDFPTFQEAAQIIAQDEEKIHRALQILNSFSTENLLMALAQHMGKDLVEHALDHLRTADGERALLLERVLYESDPLWVCESSAKRLIRNRLKNQEQGRSQLIEWLSDAEILADYIQELREFPPRFVNEWRALAQTGIREEIFINRATALLGPTPDPLVYL